MPLCTLKDIFHSPWGIVEARKGEIEAGSFGSFQKIVSDEISKRFWPIDAVATAMDAHPKTARRWLGEVNPRYIERDGKKLYFEDDAARAVELRRAAKATKKKATT